VFEGENPVSAVDAAAALADVWASHVSSLDKQQAEVQRREEEVALQQQALQHLIVGVAGVAKAARGCSNGGKPAIGRKKRRKK
jgi:hypothetical protein